MQDAPVDALNLPQLIISVIQKCAALRGWSVLAVDLDTQHEDRVIEDIQSSHVWGTVIAAHSDRTVRKVKEAGLAVVMVDAWHPDVDVDAIVQDGFRGGLQAAQYLAAREHRRVAWFGPVTGSVHSMTRFGGATTGLMGAGIGLPMDKIIVCDDRSAYDHAREVLSRPDRPTAALALWADIAIAVARAARDLGLAVGKDLDIVGWCSEEQYRRDFLPAFAGAYIPPIITWKIATMADIATTRLAERYANPDLPATRINIETRLKLGANE